MKNSILVKAQAKILTGMALLKDIFSQVNNRVNGFEHQLARRSKSFRLRRSHAPVQKQGEQEIARRLRQIERNDANRAAREN